jgi:hypothetical protein
MVSYQHKVATSALAGVTSEMSALTTYLVGALVYREQFWIATTVSRRQHAVAGIESCFGRLDRNGSPPRRSSPSPNSFCSPR